MDVIEAIRTRRTVANFRPDPVPAGDLTRLLALGVWAPNHHLTEPWRFVVAGPQTQQRLAERFAAWRMAKVAPDAADAATRRARIGEESARKFMSNPTVVAVAVALDGDEQRRREDYAATCCAIQNVQLAAWAEGVGVKWSTSGVIRDPLAYELLGLDPARYELIALLYVGYPAEFPTRERKLPLELVIRWTA